MLQTAYVYTNCFVVLCYKFGCAFLVDRHISVRPATFELHYLKIQESARAFRLCLNSLTCMLLYWTSPATTQVAVFVFVYCIGTSIPQTVVTPTLHQNCGHTYEIGTCFIVSDNL
jgi:hypothetical protein